MWDYFPGMEIFFTEYLKLAFSILCLVWTCETVRSESALPALLGASSKSILHCLLCFQSVHWTWTKSQLTVQEFQLKIKMITNCPAAARGEKGSFCTQHCCSFLKQDKAQKLACCTSGFIGTNSFYRFCQNKNVGVLGGKLNFEAVPYDQKLEKNKGNFFAAMRNLIV